MDAAVNEDPRGQRRRLRLDLRGRRTSAGLTQREVAQAMDWSVSKLVRIERGEVVISRSDLQSLLAYYGVSDRETTSALLGLQQGAKSDGWADFRDIHSEAFLTYLGLEASAEVISSYQPTLVPGLLQTKEYSSAVQALTASQDVNAIERRWQIKERRLTLHSRSTPPSMRFMIDEAVVRRKVGGDRVMMEQLVKVRDYMERDHVAIRMVSFEAGGYPEMGIPFVHLKLPNGVEQNVVYLEHAIERTVREDPDEAAAYLKQFSRIEEIALTVDDTADVLEEVIGSLGRP